jgi:hypothetical protein
MLGDLIGCGILLVALLAFADAFILSRNFLYAEEHAPSWMRVVAWLWSSRRD